MPANSKSNTSVLYWVEAPRQSAASSPLSARYVLINGDEVSAPANLSVANGAPRSWTPAQNVGDYMTGGFFFRNNALNFLAQWVEPDGIKANIVTTPFPTGCRVPASTPAWAPTVNYPLGTFVSFNSIVYEARQSHTSQTGWEPPNVPALWERPTPCNLAPWTNQTHYLVGGEVTFNGSRFKARQEHVSQVGWEPPTVPALWLLE